MKQKLAVLEELLERNSSDCSKFSSDWILRKGITSEDMRQNHDFLTKMGLSNDKITTFTYLLGMDPGVLQRNYRALQSMGLSAKKIASHAALLGRDPDTLQRNYHVLQGIGLKDSKIATCAHLLGWGPATLQRNYHVLQGMGFKDDKIATNASLLGRDPATLQHHYHALQRFLDSNKIAIHASLLGINPRTIEDNVDFSGRIGVDYHIQPLVLFTTVKKKKEKLKCFFQIVFDEDLAEDQLEDRARAFYAKNNDVNTIDRTLIPSSEHHQRNKEALRKRYNPA